MGDANRYEWDVGWCLLPLDSEDEVANEELPVPMHVAMDAPEGYEGAFKMTCAGQCQVCKQVYGLRGWSPLLELDLLWESIWLMAEAMQADIDKAIISHRLGVGDSKCKGAILNANGAV